MIEGVVKAALETLITQGSGWIVAVLLGIWVFFLDRRLTTAQEQNDRLMQEQYEKRIVEFRELLDVMTNSTNTVKAMHGGLTATSDAINQLATGFAKLLAEFQSQQTRWDDRGGTMSKQLEDIRGRIESIQRGRAT